MEILGLTRKRKLFLNTIFSLSEEATIIICGFILPRLFLVNYGSSVNGLIASIGNLLGFISLCQCGIGPVIQSSYYKPLADEDNNQISAVLCASFDFYRKLSYLLCIYVVGIVIFYPQIVSEKFDYWYVAVLVFAMSINTFAEYYLSISYRLLLGAAQCNYVCSIIHIFSLVINTIVCVVLIKNEFSVQLVKFATAGVFLLQPIFLTWVVHKLYILDLRVGFGKNTIKQKWNGLAQHVDYIVCTGLPMLALSLFSTLETVSIFAVYLIVIGGLINLLQTVFGNFVSLFGDLYARKDERILRLFCLYETFVHLSSAFIFSVTAVLIAPFVCVYTRGVTDINYNLPVFGYFMVLMAIARLLRRPYKNMILAFGEYKDTEMAFYLGSLMNVVITIIAVKMYGLVGATFGTIVVLFVQTIYIERKTVGKILGRSFVCMLSNVLADITIFGAVYLLTQTVELADLSYASWVIMALKVLIIALVVLVVVLFVFHRKEVRYSKEFIPRRS